MKLTHLIDAALLAALVIAAAVLGPWLDNQPSDTDAERAQAADLHDALVAARQQQHLARAEADMRRQQQPASGHLATVVAEAKP